MSVAVAQAEAIERQAGEIATLRAEIAALRAKLDRPPKTPDNSSLPPSQGHKKATEFVKNRKNRKKRKPHPGAHRALHPNPTHRRDVLADVCGHCGADVSLSQQEACEVYDRIEIPPVAPEITRVSLHGGVCPCCTKRFKACAPAWLEPGSPFGPNLRALVIYLRFTQGVAFERLSRLMTAAFRQFIDMACDEAERRDAWNDATLNLHKRRLEAELDRVLAVTPVHRAGIKWKSTIEKLRPTSSSSCPTATFPRPTTNPSAHCALAPPIGKSPTASAPSGAQNNTPTSAPSSKPAADSQSTPSKPSEPPSPNPSTPLSSLQGEQLLQILAPNALKIFASSKAQAPEETRSSLLGQELKGPRGRARRAIDSAQPPLL